MREDVFYSFCLKKSSGKRKDFIVFSRSVIIKGGVLDWDFERIF